MHSICVKFENELQEHLEAERLIYRQTFFGKADKVVAILVIAFGIYGVAVAGIQWWTIIWFPVGVAEWFDLLTLSRLRTRVLYQRNPKYLEEYQITFSPELIHFQTASIDSTVKWTHYERVIESPSLFLLMYGKSLYTLVPKRSFSSPEDLNAFRELVETAVSKRT